MTEAQGNEVISLLWMILLMVSFAIGFGSYIWLMLHRD